METTTGPVIDQLNHPWLSDLAKTNFLHMNFYMPIVLIDITPDSEAVIRFVPKVSTPRNVIGRGRRICSGIVALLRFVELRGMRDYPYMHPMQPSKAPDFREGMRDIFRLRLGWRATMLNLIPGIKHQPLNS